MKVWLWIFCVIYIAAVPIYLAHHIGDTIVQVIDYYFVFGTAMMVAIPFALGYLVSVEEPDELKPTSFGKIK